MSKYGSVAVFSIFFLLNSVDCQADSLDEALKISGQRVKEANDFRARTVLQSAATGQEAYSIDNDDKYVSCKNESCAKQIPGCFISSGVQIEFQAFPGGYRGQASHTKGTGKVWYWDSTKGGLQP